MQRRGGMELWNTGALEARFGPGDVEEWRYEVLELWRRAAGVQMQVRRYRALEARFKRADVEA